MSRSGWIELNGSSRHQDWQTPRWLFSLLQDEFEFELDAAAAAHNTLCCHWFDESDDALCQDWTQPESYSSNALENPAWGGAPWDRVWGNPPYGREVGKGLQKAYRESRKGLTVVCLVMASTDTEWWHEWVGKATQVRLLKGRLHFTRNDKAGPAPKGSAIVVFTPWWAGPPQVVMWNPKERVQ